MFKFTVLVIISGVLTNYLLDLSFVQEQLNKFIPSDSVRPKTILFTEEELAKFNGENNQPLYLSILGNIYDVTKGAAYYKKGETYHALVGRDNSRNFIIGNFEESAVSDNVIPLSQAEFRGLNHWAQFYKKEYPKVGKLIGRYYNSNGKLTPYGKEVKLLIKEAELAQANDDANKRLFPPCNIEWEAATGTRVWCTNKSGGIERDWVGVPREYFEVGNEKRCACIHEGNKHLGSVQEYEGCAPDSESCFVKKN